MNRNRSAGAALLPFVACISSLGQDPFNTPFDRQPAGQRETAATEPDLRLEPIASRVAQGKLYSLAPLADGRMLAFDRNDHKPVYVMTRTRAISGSYTLALNGSVSVKEGVVTGLSGATVQSTAHTLSLDSQGKLVAKWRVRIPADVVNRANLRRTLSIVDLKDGRLMLLEGNRIYQLKVRRAPDGDYQLPEIGRLTVLNGVLNAGNGGPVLDFGVDFEP